MRAAVARLTVSSNSLDRSRAAIKLRTASDAVPPRGIDRRASGDLAFATSTAKSPHTWRNLPPMAPIMQTDFPGLKLLGRGKVRDNYDLGDALLIVSTDRISA